VSQLRSKVTVTSCSFYINCSMCPTFCWTTHWSRQCHWPVAWSVKCCNSDISQGCVATHLRCGGIFRDDIIANFFLILTVKQIRK